MPEQHTNPAILADTTRPATGGCFHCGEPCPEPASVWHGKAFCCFGCQTVFTLLHENGLAQFYELNSRPGVRVRETAAAAKWAFLDDPLVQETLLDYADKSQAKVTLHLPAIHCVACVWLLENLFKLHPGIGQSQVNFPRREAAITFAPDRIKFRELASLLASIGYEPELTLSALEKKPASNLAKKTWLQIGLAGFAFGNIMLMALPFYFGLDDFNGPWFKALAGWLGLALALPVVTFSAADFWQAAWLSVRQRVLTLEIPVVLGLAAIYAASVFEVFSHRGPGYCDTLCALIFFLLCGRLFQRKTHDRLTFDRDYKGFFPLSVIRKSAAGEESVAISQLQVSDHVVLRNGELLPADARLVSGEACMDYSFVTGESEPVACAVGAHLFAGGRQAGGAVEVEIVKPVAQSYLASLWNHETFRKRRDRGLDSLTNRYSKYFTKLVLGVALAAPLTHGTAQRLLARLKIFLKNALVFERMAEVDAVVLDKTGTLTTADAGGVEFQSAEAGMRGAELTADELDWTGSLARLSTHPNSIRLTKALPFEPSPVADFKETPGCGIEGKVAGHRLKLGSPAWMQGEGVAAGQASCLSNPAERKACPTKTGNVVSLAIDGKCRGTFTLQNSVRPEVAQLIAELGGRFELALLSGDNECEAARFRKLFGENATLKFNQSPADKLNFIRDLQKRGRRVMMVGDGLNDAGALKQAEVGVAVVEQVGVFSPASDVILDAAELPRLARVLKFSRQAGHVVRAAFVISAIYNLVGVSVAVAGLLSPIVCAILMPLSSATVVVFTCGMTFWLARKTFGLRWQSAAATPFSTPVEPKQSGVALRFPPQSKLEAA